MNRTFYPEFEYLSSKKTIFAFSVDSYLLMNQFDTNKYLGKY